MTRETKIGLLVGLAFIIVIGILLEDHFSSINEPKPAPLAVVGPNVRAGTGNPGGDGVSTLTAQEGSPRNEIQTGHESQHHVTEIKGNDSKQTARPDNGIADVRVGPSGNIDAGNTHKTTQPQDAGPARTVTPNISKGEGTADDLTAWAKNAGEPLEKVDAHGRRASDPAPAAGTQEYVVVAGDSVSKIARKIFGTDTKANREAIIKANPSLQQNPDKVIVGQSYVVPLPANAAPAPAPKTAESHATPTAPAATAENWYTTQPGDSLWRIAVDQCGNASAVAAIKQLNPDRFPNGSTNVQANWKLRLPAKTVASGN